MKTIISVVAGALALFAVSAQADDSLPFGATKSTNNYYGSGNAYSSTSVTVPVGNSGFSVGGYSNTSVSGGGYSIDGSGAPQPTNSGTSGDTVRGGVIQYNY